MRLTTVLCLVTIRICSAAQTILSVHIQQESDTTPLPCRAWVEAGDKRLFQPKDQDCTPYTRDRSFCCDGQFSIEAPPGKAVVHVERGKEYLAIDQPVE